jgi:hypothetical protein
MDIYDLAPRKDPKGGSPRTPSGGVPLRTYQEYSQVNGNGNGTIWKMATSLLSGLVIGLLVAWFSAMQTKGVSGKDMQDYVDRFSPYLKDKDTINAHNSIQDQQIGELRGGDERINARLNALDVKLVGDERDISDLKNKLDLATNYLEELKKGKR